MRGYGIRSHSKNTIQPSYKVVEYFLKTYNIVKVKINPLKLCVYSYAVSQLQYGVNPRTQGCSKVDALTPETRNTVTVFQITVSSLLNCQVIQYAECDVSQKRLWSLSVKC